MHENINEFDESLLNFLRVELHKKSATDVDFEECFKFHEYLLTNIGLNTTKNDSSKSWKYW